MTEQGKNLDNSPLAGPEELMWDGWILDFDGSVHAARTIDLGVLPGPHGMLLRLSYAMTPEHERLGLVRTVQVSLDEAQVAALAIELLDYRNKRRGPVPKG